MRHDDHILDRASSEMLARARAAKAMYRTVERAIGVEQERAGQTTRGLVP